MQPGHLRDRPAFHWTSWTATTSQAQIDELLEWTQHIDITINVTAQLERIRRTALGCPELSPPPHTISA